MEKIIKHKIDDEFKSICEQIFNENLSITQWKLIESDDQFQSEN